MQDPTRHNARRHVEPDEQHRDDAGELGSLHVGSPQIEGFMREALKMVLYTPCRLLLRARPGKNIKASQAYADTDETPVGCVFVRGGEIIGRGMNDTNSSLNGTRHAEFIALEDVFTRFPASALRHTDLFVTVEPCIMCASALRQYGIRSVYFGCANDRFGGTGGVLSIHAE
ncbi:MAG: tRNA(adenine34) deaminase [Thelocarpon impressellum]|nr:MAG: tRNA(adenine34) deaminase [Thelocarpon impressellum]